MKEVSRCHLGTPSLCGGPRDGQTVGGTGLGTYHGRCPELIQEGFLEEGGLSNLLKEPKGRRDGEWPAVSPTLWDF